MTRPALIFLFVLAAVPRASFGQGSALASCPCTLKGRVLNSVTGAPIRNALVESNVGSPNATLTDSDGDFHFDALPAGPATLSAVKPGFLPSALFMAAEASVPVAPDAPLALIKLVPGGVVRGHISDDQGLPLENFSVQLLRRTPGFSEPSRQSFFTIVTNDLGNFRIPDLPAGSYYLLAAPEDARLFRRPADEIPIGYAQVYYPGVIDLSAATPVKVSAGRESIANLTLTAKPFVRLSGKVSGYPPGSSVQLYLGRTGDLEAAQAMKLDQRTGAFQTDWIPPGTHIIAAAAEGASSSAQGASLTAYLSVSATSSMSGLNLVVVPGVNIPVSVEGLSQKGDLAQLAVQLTAKDTGNIQTAEPMTKNSDPNLSSAEMYFLDLPQGTYHFDLSSSSSDPYFAESATFGSVDLLTNDFVVDSSSAAHPIEISVRRGAATLSGTVNLKDATRGAVVCLFSAKSNAQPRFQNAGADGSFRFETLPPGDYRIAAVDSLLDIDFSNPATLKKISSAASEISLAPSQSLALSLDLTAVEE